MKLSIIMPVYNEEKSIATILAKVMKQPVLGLDKEVIVVDDGSRDRSKRIIEEVIKKHPKAGIRFFNHEKNQGKGAAVRTGIREAKGDILLIQDSDLEYDPKIYPELLKPILNRETKVVYGSRLLGHHIDMYWLHKFGNDFLTFVTNLLYGVKISDMETGYKVFRKEVVKDMKLKARAFDFEPEITCKILKRRYRIKEVPVPFDNPRSFKEGKKIDWRDGVQHIYYLFKYRFFD